MRGFFRITNLIYHNQLCRKARPTRFGMLLAKNHAGSGNSRIFFIKDRLNHKGRFFR